MKRFFRYQWFIFAFFICYVRLRNYLHVRRLRRSLRKTNRLLNRLHRSCYRMNCFFLLSFPGSKTSHYLIANFPESKMVNCFFLLKILQKNFLLNFLRIRF
jgi:hypothetical protein